MDPVSLSSGIAGLITLALQVSGTVAEYVTAVKDKSKNIKEVHDELLLLGEVLSQLRDFLHSEGLRGRAFDGNSVLHRAIINCRVRIERIGDKLKPADGGKLSRAIDRLKWPFEQKEVFQMLENLRRFSQTFQFAVSIEGCTILSKTSDDAGESLKQMREMSQRITDMSLQMGLSADDAIKRGLQIDQVLALLPALAQTVGEVTEISQAVRLAEQREQERRKTDILDWLAPVSALHKHGDIQAKRAPNTGRWFLDHPDFVHWVETPSEQQDLLCIGGPGVGKSILCSFVIDHLRQKYKGADVAVVHYYCDYSEQQSQTPVHLTRVLLRQLCVFCQAIPSVVAEFYQKTKNDVKDQVWFQDLKRVLQRVLATFNRSYLIIDAFDETEAHNHRSGLLDVVATFRTAPGISKVFATTRPHLDYIEDKFYQPIKINVIANPDDLRQYIIKRIEDHPDYDNIMDETIKVEILDKLTTNAHGMFLLPALQIQDILDQVTKADVRRKLRNLPVDLTQAFSSTFDRIATLSNTRKDVASRTLMWLSHAMRPLTIQELQHALAMRFEDDEIDRDNFLSLRTILDSCCGLVEVDRESLIVSLVHYSLKEYLQSKENGFFEPEHTKVTRVCLKYMSMKSVDSLPFKNRMDFSKALSDLSFLEYACLEWGHHAHHVRVEEIQDLAIPLLTNSRHLLAMARVRDHRSPDFRKFREKMWSWALSGGGGISLATSFGLTDLVRLLLTSDPKSMVSARNMYGSTPLHEAAMLGYESTAELLIAHGADIMDKNYGKSTPFYLAVCYSQLSMAKTLIKYGHAQVDSKCRDGFTPLHKAVDLGSEPMVEFLLQHNALVAAQDDHGMTPLHHAARRGNIEIAKLLVLAGATIHVKAKEKVFPLDLAATAGHTEIVELFLENGETVDYRSEFQWTPLHRAARGGHLEIINLFFKHGSNLMVEDSKGNLPLHLAIRSGSIDAVKKILQHDPEKQKQQLFHRDRKGSTPREIAFFTANYNIHKYLRAEEWNLLDATPNDSNKLTTAIERGSIDEVQQLLDTKLLNLEIPDEDGQPPLHVAAQESQLEIANLLLSHHASINTAGYHGWRPLHIAASLGNLAMVDLFLSHNPDINARTSSMQTVLHKAASSNSLPVVQRLLDAGTELEARNDRGMTALHVAAHQNNIDLVRFLVLTVHADVLARDKFGNTPATWAERSTHLQIAAFLRIAERKAKGTTLSAESTEETALIADLEVDEEIQDGVAAMLLV